VSGFKEIEFKIDSMKFVNTFLKKYFLKNKKDRLWFFVFSKKSRHMHNHDQLLSVIGVTSD